jgi:hypothetical protein
MILNKINRNYLIIATLWVAIIYILYTALLQPLYGNPTIYPLHSYILAIENNLYFTLPNDLYSNVKYEPSFHTLLYVLLLALFYKVFLYLDFFVVHHDYIPRIFTIFIYLFITYIINKIFLKLKINDIFYRSLYLIGFLSLTVVYFSVMMPTMDPSLTALCLLLVFYFFINNETVDTKKAFLQLTFLSVLAILSKETTGAIGLFIIFFYFTFIEKKIFIKYTFMIGFLTIFFATMIHIILCKLYGLDPMLIINATLHHTGNRAISLHNIFLYIKVILLLFSPLLIIVLFNILKNIKINKINILFLIIIVIISLIYFKQGITQPRYLLAFLPILYIITIINLEHKMKVSKKTYFYALLLIIYFYIVFDDPIASLSSFATMTSQELFINLFSYILPFLILFIKRFNFKEYLIIYLLLNIYLLFQYSSHNYLKYIAHGQKGYSESLDILKKSDEFIVSDISGVEYYFRNRILYPITPKSHYFTSNIEEHNISRKVNADRLNHINILINDGGFYIFTTANSNLERYIIDKNKDGYSCTEIIKQDFILLKCKRN